MAIALKVFYFQGLWYASAFLGSKNYQLLALGLCMASLFFDYLIFKYDNIKLKNYLIFIASLVLAGFALDKTFQLIGLLSWSSGTLYPGALLGIWLIFAAYYPNLFTKFEEKTVLAFILGAIFGPLAYWTGGEIGAISYQLKPQLVGLHALGWGSFFSLSLMTFKKFKIREVYGIY